MSLLDLLLALAFAQAPSFEEKFLGVVPEGDRLQDHAFSHDERQVAFSAVKGRELWGKVVDAF